MQGNVVDHDDVIQGDGEEIADVSKTWMRARDTDGVGCAARPLEGWCRQTELLRSGSRCRHGPAATMTDRHMNVIEETL